MKVPEPQTEGAVAAHDHAEARRAGHRSPRPRRRRARHLQRWRGTRNGRTHGRASVGQATQARFVSGDASGRPRRSAQGKPGSDVATLARAGFSMRIIRQALDDAGIDEDGSERIGSEIVSPHTLSRQLSWLGISTTGFPLVIPGTCPFGIHTFCFRNFLHLLTHVIRCWMAVFGMGGCDGSWSVR